MLKKINPTETFVKNDNPEFGGCDYPNGTVTHMDARVFVPNALPRLSRGPGENKPRGLYEQMAGVVAAANP